MILSAPVCISAFVLIGLFTGALASRLKRNIREHTRLCREAQNAIRLREDVLAIVSHDLKNPLGIVQGFNEILADALRKRHAPKAEIEATEAIARSVRQMERLIGDLLDFAKIRSGTFVVETKTGSVNRLIWEGIETVHHHLEKKAVLVSVDVPPDIPDVRCDPDRIRQVFSNLLGNAIKFVPEKVGRITIRAAVHRGKIVFSVSDNGPGMSQDCLSHVFDRYWQAKETAKQGTGLGLSIAKGIIEGHHERIWVESEVGKGTTFYFTLATVTRELLPVYSPEVQSLQIPS